jgi:hypothetical protein
VRENCTDTATPLKLLPVYLQHDEQISHNCSLSRRHVEIVHNDAELGMNIHCERDNHRAITAAAADDYVAP